MKRWTWLGGLGICACAAAGCAGGAGSAVPVVGSAEQVSEQGADPRPRFGAFGMDEDGMDRSVHPGDDFYRFANGRWEETTTIPSDRARYGMFDLLTLEAEEDVQRIILDAAAAGGVAGSNTQMIGDMYAAWMDAETIDARGPDVLRPYLEEVAAAEDAAGLALLMGTLRHQAFYGLWISPDPADPSVHVLRVFQSGLGMPTRDYYLDPSPRFDEYRQAYVAHVARIFSLLGLDRTHERAEGVMALEVALAETHWTRERSRQVTETYNVMTLEELDTLAPALRFPEVLAARGLPEVPRVVVSQPDALEAASRLLLTQAPEVVRDYLVFHFVSGRAAALGSTFDEARFDFFGRVLAGIEEQRPRDRRGTQLVGGSLGHALGQEYVERHFPARSRALMDELVTNLIVAFRGRLEQLPWMDDTTRAEALAKLGTFEARIGYPEVWDSFEGLVVERDDHFGNMMRLAEHGWNDMVARYPLPVDRRRWGWPPQIVNASYNPLMNQITFPAGILQAPFFDPYADAAMNYGAIGAVIGHEIGHGFDDQGRRYDAQGRIRDWWTAETNERFMDAADRLAEQYSAFCPLEGLCVNGRLALGENIGDLGGMQMAYAAYRAHVAATYPEGEAPVVGGFTGDQRFFLAWAQVWRSLYREDALRAQLVNGPHAPGQFRVNGVVRNLDAWYDAFGVTEDHALYLPPDERVRIW